MPKQLLIDIDLAQAIASYLAQRPYREVFQLLSQLQGLQEAPQATGSEPSTAT